MATRTGYVTAEQKEGLIEYMKNNIQLRSGKFSATFIAKDGQKMDRMR